MSKFALEHIEKIKGRIEFYFLIIDGVIQYNVFEEELKRDGGYESELRTLNVRIQEMSEMRQPMPQSKCKVIGPDEYELKTKNLRCYLFHEKNKGNIIVMLAKKKPGSKQQKDIRKFRKIKKDYLNQKAC